MCFFIVNSPFCQKQLETGTHNRLKTKVQNDLLPTVELLLFKGMSVAYIQHETSITRTVTFNWKISYTVNWIKLMAKLFPHTIQLKILSTNNPTSRFLNSALNNNQNSPLVALRGIGRTHVWLELHTINDDSSVS